MLYRSPSEADIAVSAEIVGTVTRLPTQSNFIYGVILSLATLISFLGFVVAGIVSLWLLRTSSSRAVGAVLRKPIRSFLTGIVAVIVLPAAVITLAMTLVGLPLAAVGVLVGAVAFIIGPVPAVTALGNRVLVNRGGLFGAFVVGAVLWRLGIWLIPVVGGFIYLVALVWGIGAWVLGLAAARRGDPTPPALIPASMIAGSEIPADWEPPLAPRRTDPEPPVMAPETSPTSENVDPGGPIESSSPFESSEPDPVPDDETMPATDPDPVSRDEESPPEETDNWGLPRQ